MAYRVQRHGFYRRDRVPARIDVEGAVREFNIGVEWPISRVHLRDLDGGILQRMHVRVFLYA